MFGYWRCDNNKTNNSAPGCRLAAENMWVYTFTLLLTPTRNSAITQKVSTIKIERIVSIKNSNFEQLQRRRLGQCCCYCCFKCFPIILTIFQSYSVCFAGIRLSPAECVNITFNYKQKREKFSVLPHVLSVTQRQIGNFPLPCFQWKSCGTKQNPRWRLIVLGKFYCHLPRRFGNFVEKYPASR